MREPGKPQQACNSISWPTAIAVFFCLVPAVFWAVWGGAEIFHESGVWYAGMVQYVIPWIPFVLLALIGILWARFAVALALALSVAAVFFMEPLRLWDSCVVRLL